MVGKTTQTIDTTIGSSTFGPFGTSTFRDQDSATQTIAEGTSTLSSPTGDVSTHSPDVESTSDITSSIEATTSLESTATEDVGSTVASTVIFPTTSSVDITQYQTTGAPSERSSTVDEGNFEGSTSMIYGSTIVTSQEVALHSGMRASTETDDLTDLPSTTPLMEYGTSTTSTSVSSDATAGTGITETVVPIFPKSDSLIIDKESSNSTTTSYDEGSTL
ncbi:unnamed protein product, partial [Nesidiocoris tenuis]